MAVWRMVLTTDSDGKCQIGWDVVNSILDSIETSGDKNIPH